MFDANLCKITIQRKPYRQIFCPEGQIYAGPSGNELRQGMQYPEWIVNDHCFIRDRTNHWHLFGITHPLTTAANIHEGEVQLFHAESDTIHGSYRDKGTILTPQERPGEQANIHSPVIIVRNDIYHMIYGPEQLRLATSSDLITWQLRGSVIEETGSDARDPQILFHDNTYIICYCIGNQVCFRTSKDLLDWSEHQLLLELEDGIAPESPFLYYHNGTFFLLVCLWDGIWDRRTVSQAYQSKTRVYAAKELRTFHPRDYLTSLDAHAPEIVESNGKIYLSSAEYPERGIHLAELIISQ